MTMHSPSLLAEEASLINKTKLTPQPATATPTADEDESLIPESTNIDTDAALSLLDQPQAYVSSGVSNLTKSIDEFFSNEKVLYETSGSYIRINGDAIYNEGGDSGFAGNVKIKIALPNTQKKLKLVIESDPNETREDIDQEQQPTPLEAVQDKTYFAGLESSGKEVRNWKLRPGIGLKLNSGLDILLRYRASRNVDISKNWRAYLSETIYWYNSEGFRFNSTLELNRKIYDNFLFRSSTFAGWREETQYWNLNQIFSLTQSLSNRSQISYRAGIFGISEPNVIATDYLFEIRYRKRVHSDYLFAELIPRVLYERETNFTENLSLTFRLEIVFKS